MIISGDASTKSREGLSPRTAAHRLYPLKGREFADEEEDAGGIRAVILHHAPRVTFGDDFVHFPPDKGRRVYHALQSGNVYIDSSSAPNWAFGSLDLFDACVIDTAATALSGMDLEEFAFPAGCLVVHGDFWTKDVAVSGGYWPNEPFTKTSIIGGPGERYTRTKSPIREKLDEIVSLGDNWDADGADAISADVANYAAAIAHAVLDVAGEPFIGPAPDGSILLEWEFPGGRSVDLFIEDGEAPSVAAVTLGGKVYRVRFANRSQLHSMLSDLAHWTSASTNWNP